METPVPDAGATGTVTLCPEQPCWAGGAVPRRQLRAAGPSSARCPRPERGAAPAVPGPGEGARRPRAKAVAGGSRRGPDPGSDPDPGPSPGPARPARPRLRPRLRDRGYLSPAGAAGSRFGRISTEGR